MTPEVVPDLPHQPFTGVAENPQMVRHERHRRSTRTRAQLMGPADKGWFALPVAAAVDEREDHPKGNDLNGIAAKASQGVPQLPPSLAALPLLRKDTFHFHDQEADSSEDETRSLGQEGGSKPDGREVGKVGDFFDGRWHGGLSGG